MTLYNEDCLTTMLKMADNSVNLTVTSPPYNKAGISGGNKKAANQIWGKFNIDYDEYQDNLTEDEYQNWMIEVLNELYRITAIDGSVFFNHKPRRANNKAYLPTDFISKSKFNIYQLIIWDRKNSPNIRNDIFVPSTEHIYWLTKNKPKTFRNNVDKEFRGEVWSLPAQRQKEHPAPYPEKIVENCIQMTTEIGDLVYDPFMGSGTTAVSAIKFGREWVGSEISINYCNIANERISSVYGLDF